MLKLPVKFLLACLSVFLVLLGAHGLYIHFSQFEAFLGLFGDNLGKLFLTFEFPAKLASVIMWMSWKGIQSWFIPAVFIAGGLALWGLQLGIKVYGLRLPRFFRWLW